MAMTRFWRTWPARIGVGLLGLFVLVATYGPFIASDVALVWWDDDGLRFPVITDLFNMNSYGKPHHLLFNLLALLLPIFVILWLVLGRFWHWSGPGRALLCTTLLVVSIIASLLPWLPPAVDDGPLRSPWTKRPAPVETFGAWQALPETERPSAVFPLIPHSYRAKFFSYEWPLTENKDTGHNFWLGTDDRGGDVLVRMIFGARVSLTIGLVAVGISMLIGVVIGAVSGYFGGWVDIVLQRLVELMMAFPTFILVLVVVAMWGRDIYTIMIVFGITGWAGTARLVRGEFLAQSAREYVLAAETLGLTRARIMFRHILPNTLTPLLISATFGIAGTVLTESSLAFIGMGDDSVPSWGSLLDVGRRQVLYSWLIWVPGVAIFGLVASLNLVGNALREALDPRGSA
jgi:peptide/nickel transport system permease protein